MKNHTTFKIGGKAAFFIEPKNEGEIAEVLSAVKVFNKRFLVIGNGSNMLISDDEIDCVFIYIGEKLSEVKLLDENRIRCESGALLSKACNFALENSLTGMEELFGIPGSVGGAVYMNAGAYGGEIKDVILSCTTMDTDGNIHTYRKEELDLSYRHSRFSDKDEVILSADFCLEKGDKDEIKAEMKDFLSRRKDKQPVEFPSAGSVFKRPEGYFAGALIENCGLKGKQIGGAQVSEKHAGFIINRGNATAKDVLSLIELCQNTVKEKTGVLLEPEIRCLS